MKNKLLYFICLVLITMNVTAQKNKNQKDIVRDLQALFSSDMQLVSLAVDSSICIIRQEYTLIDSAGNEYGRNSNAFFGEKYSLGVITDSGVYTTTEILSPWKDDTNFDRYKKDDSLKPHLSKTWYKRAGDQKFVVMNVGESKKMMDSALAIIPAPDSLPAINNDINTKDTTGWLVLATAKEAADLKDSAVLNLKISRPSFLADSTGKLYLKNFTAKDNLIGGIYYTSAISTGKILFAAAGILTKDNRGWYIKTFTAKMPAVKAAENTLSPVKKANKK